LIGVPYQVAATAQRSDGVTFYSTFVPPWLAAIGAGNIPRITKAAEANPDLLDAIKAAAILSPLAVVTLLVGQELVPADLLTRLS